MTVQVKKSDGGYILLSADGRESDLGQPMTTWMCSRNPRVCSGLVMAGGGYDLIDWHGNVLLSGSSGYSMSANGSYLISQEGYTSSTLYMVNDAEPVDLVNSAGGATEMQIETKEGASLEAYTGDVTVENVGTVLSELFIDGTDLMLATNDDEKYAVMDVTDTQYSEPKYSSYTSYKQRFCSRAGCRYGEDRSYDGESTAGRTL